MSGGTVTGMSVHMARAIREALLDKEKNGNDADFSAIAGKLASRFTSEIWWSETGRQ
ncbi:hypothetical protein [Nocardia ninae]|nr:hypothetical protein [Nocardia ninae]